MSAQLEFAEGGVTAARGYRAAAAAAGIKTGRNDMAMVVSQVPATIAGVFTTNAVQAAPVKLCRQCVHAGRGQAVVVNAGNANACTGPRGTADARRMAELAAQALALDPALVLVCSTGTIGIPMPMAKIEYGMPLLAAALTPTGGDAAARAIMTTDTVPKQCAVRIRIDGRTVSVGGMAKGAGMIAPNMATMLGFITTDAAVDGRALQSCLRAAVEQSFNRISVDEDQSTNDTVLFFANGVAGNQPLTAQHPEWAAFCAAVDAVTRDLAMKIVADGEGATKRVTVTVEGAASGDDARRAARAISHSLLVKTSWFGGDPNWGRVIAAVGYSGARVDEDKVDIFYDAAQLVRGGQAAGASSLAELERILKQKEFTLRVNLNVGRAAYSMVTCDLSEEYVRINGSYMT